MPAALTKVIYKSDTQSTDEFTVMVNPEEYKKWSEGDTSIPLVDVVQSFTIYFSNQGSQGKLGQASKQQLENVFKTSKEDEAVAQVLKLGKAQKADGIQHSFGSTNVTKGSYSADTRGGNRTTGI